LASGEAVSPRKTSGVSFGAALGRQAREVALEAGWLLAGAYPGFVTARRAAPLANEIPVFVFHSIEPVEFEAQLRFLAENRYRTLDCATYLRCLSGESPVPPGAVMLTIDDGRSSVWTFGFPLLKKYGMRAVVFLIPGLVRETGSPAPTLDDVWSGRLKAEEVRDRDPDLMSWPEIRAMAASGCADFQSHTLHHHPVPVGPRILGVVDPRQGKPAYDVPMPCGMAETLTGAGAGALAGMPIFAARPLMAGNRIFRPDPGFMDACRAAFTEADPDPLARVRGIAKRHRERHGGLGRVDSDEATAHEMLRSLRRSRELISEHLDAPCVRHLCYPYTIGSQLSVRLSREAGYVSNFWGVLPGRKINRPGDDPFRSARLKGDFVFRMAGRGRLGIGEILLAKARRRWSGRPVY
jgi:peptidoglycan/xylan/chitin deacetylase (PgdA/CDA1 family)